MQHVEGRFTGVGGMELYCHHWLPASDPSAVVVLVHGVGEHSGRYERIVGPMVDAGYAVYSYDHRGHGKSPGPRVYIDRWTDYRDDLRTYLALAARAHPGVPLVLYGHSMGSLVALDYLLEQPKELSGAIISGVATEPKGVGSPFQIFMAKTLSGVVPKLSVDLGIEAESLTRDPQSLAAFKADELCTGRATVRWGAESLATVDRIKAGMGAIALPILVVHGEADPLNDVAGAQNLYAAVRSEDKTLRTYPDVLHEPHNDLDHALLATDVTTWVAHLVASSN